MAALSGYYLPLARANSSTVTKEQIQRAVVDGIGRLRLQEQNFRELAGLCGEISASELKSSSKNVDDNWGLQAVSETPPLMPNNVDKTDKLEPEFDPEEMF